MPVRFRGYGWLPVLRRLRGRGAFHVRDPGRRPDGGDRDKRGLADELRRGRDAQGGAGRADPRPGGGPGGPRAMHHRHERAPGGPLDGGIHVEAGHLPTTGRDRLRDGSRYCRLVICRWLPFGMAPGARAHW
jgi:hypothetical protein